MQKLLKTVLQVSCGFIIAAALSGLAVIVESLAGAPLDWGVAGTVLLVIVVVSVEYGIGALVILIVRLLSRSSQELGAIAFGLLGIIVPLFHGIAINIPAVYSASVHLPWAVVPAIIGLCGALVTLVASLRHRVFKSAGRA